MRTAPLALAAALLAGTAAAQTARTFFLYDDLPTAPWSGFLGPLDGSSLALDLRATDAPAAGVYHARLAFDGSEPWAGVYLQSEPDNWTGPGVDLSGTSLTFRIRANRPAQTVDVKALNDQVLQGLVVGPAWQTVTLPLAGLATDDVWNLLGFVATGITPGLVVDVDEVAVTYARPAEAPTQVQVVGAAQPAWTHELVVGGQPFRVRGIGYDESRSAWYATDVQLAAAHGANTLRQWAPLTSSFALLDAAHAAGLYVVPGYWLPRGDEGLAVDYDDDAFRDAVSRSVANWVACFRDHPAVLAWGLGNEVFANLSPRTEEHLDAFATLLDRLAQEVAALDPHHPTTYAAVGLDPLARVATTSIDVYGVNAYGNTADVLRRYRTEGVALARPLLFLELGPNGWWEEDWASYTHVERALDLGRRWLAVRRAEGLALGACAFAWVDKEEAGFTGWGLVNDDRSARPESALLRLLWTGRLLPQRALAGPPR